MYLYVYISTYFYTFTPCGAGARALWGGALPATAGACNSHKHIHVLYLCIYIHMNIHIDIHKSIYTYISYLNLYLRTIYISIFMYVYSRIIQYIFTPSGAGARAFRGVRCQRSAEPARGIHHTKHPETSDLNPKP